MNQYIRTKNGIYEVVDTYEVSYVIGYTEDGFEKKVYKEDVIKQADTIEELCDEFVVVNLKYNIHRFYDKTKSDWTLQTYACSPTHIVYGAIWTSKGLEFVAKMNSDGSLHLIYELLFSESTV